MFQKQNSKGNCLTVVVAYLGIVSKKAIALFKPLMKCHCQSSSNCIMCFLFFVLKIKKYRREYFQISSCSFKNEPCSNGKLYPDFLFINFTRKIRALNLCTINLDDSVFLEKSLCPIILSNFIDDLVIFPLPFPFLCLTFVSVGRNFLSN